MTNKEFKVGCTYSDKRGNKWKITGNDNVGCFPLLAESENYKGVNCDSPMYYDEFTTKGGYQEDEPSDFDLVWQPQSDYALLEFKRKCNDFNVISGKDKYPTETDIENQVKLIREETKELSEAHAYEEPEINLLQESVDLLVVTLGLIEMLRKKGYDVDGALLAVPDCNLSKFTKDRDEAWKSMEDYHKAGTEVTVDYNEEHKVYVIKDTKDKVRKPTGFKKVNLEEFKPKYSTGGDCKAQDQNGLAYSTIKTN